MPRQHQTPSWSSEVLDCPVCGRTFTQQRYGQTYCTVECRQQRRGQQWKPKASSTARGYGAAHQRERRNWKPIVEGGQALCSICEQPIEPGTPWHLDHTDDRTGYRGPAHARCNSQAGGRRRHQIVRERRAAALARWIL